MEFQLRCQYHTMGKNFPQEMSTKLDVMVQENEADYYLST
jgi:hypothetical protein